MWNRGAHATRERLSEIQAALPFAITKLDFDNGTEFLNAHFTTPRNTGCCAKSGNPTAK